MENIFISDIRRYENTTVRIASIRELEKRGTKKSSGINETTRDCKNNTNGIEAERIALAGTGSPINEVSCRVSTLNFASRIAEQTGISNAK